MSDQKPKAYYHCSFCGKHRSRVANLLVANDKSICNECTALVGEAILRGEETFTPKHAGLPCSFCHRGMDEVPRVIAMGATLYICGDCCAAAPKKLALTACRCSLCQKGVGKALVNGEGQALCETCIAEIAAAFAEEAGSPG